MSVVGVSLLLGGSNHASRFGLVEVFAAVSRVRFRVIWRSRFEAAFICNSESLDAWAGFSLNGVPLQSR